MIKKIGFVLKDDREAALPVVKAINEFLKDTGISTSEEDLDRADLIITLGGDGTLLKAAELIKGLRIPIFGINMGTTGFLTEAAPDNWEGYLERILAGDYRVSKRTKLKVEMGGKVIGEALNEAVVFTHQPVRMHEFRISVDQKMAQDVRADGVIVASPTGSTAYSMSAGGPILSPSVGAFIITTISPFKLTARPYIVPDTSSINIKIVDETRDAVLVLDGQRSFTLSKGGEATVSKSEHRTYLVKFGGGFYKKLRERLGA